MLFQVEGTYEKFELPTESYEKCDVMYMYCVINRRRDLKLYKSLCCIIK